MKIQYFDTCWKDLKNSPGWKGKVCLLALLNMVPIFGQITMFGYAYGWAREMAWGMHNPLPRNIFENPDGTFWRRGWFAVVIVIVWAIAPIAIIFTGETMAEIGAGLDPLSYSGKSNGPINLSLLLGGILLYLAGTALNLFTRALSWVSCMRSAIYNKLKPGLQFGKVWKMVRRDGFGLFKIFGMYFCISLIFSLMAIIAVTIIGLMVFVPLIIGVKSSENMSAPLIIAAILVLIALYLALLYLSLIVTTFSELMVARAMGYWTLQFDMAHWGKPNDPLPFELDPQAHPAPDYGRNDPPVR